MSGGSVAYNLRPNKYVERQLFVELLGLICKGYNPDRYVYVSLGGPQLEDHKIVHQALGFRKLVSIEADPVVHQRQLFNLRPSYVECRRETTGDFVANFDEFSSNYQDKEFIIWFDYASATERMQQLIEFEALLSRLQAGDIFKITLNANPGSLGEKYRGESHETLLQRRFMVLQEQLHKYLPIESVSHEDMTGRHFPRVLCSTVKNAALEATQHMRGLQPVPLSIFTYQDGHHLMLTVTIILLKGSDVLEFKERLRIQEWTYLPDDWTNIRKIDVPNLTAKERLYIEEFLFSDEHQVVHSRLPFRFASDEEASLKVLEEYARHYRRYPSYFQVVL